MKCRAWWSARPTPPARRCGVRRSACVASSPTATPSRSAPPSTACPMVAPATVAVRWPTATSTPSIWKRWKSARAPPTSPRARTRRWAVR
ncbi:hypothetical protein G6F68_018891 [Rhizopus microsporus]|nr:hypothetical protein G6F68_018891 [Rhizopus microsporus]